MLVYYFVPFIVSNRYLLFWVSNGHNSVTAQNRTHVYMDFFDHKDLGNHLLQLCPKVVKHPVYYALCIFYLPTEPKYGLQYTFSKVQENYKWKASWAAGLRWLSWTASTRANHTTANFSVSRYFFRKENQNECDNQLNNVLQQIITEMNSGRKVQIQTGTFWIKSCQRTPLRSFMRHVSTTFFFPLEFSFS